MHYHCLAAIIFRFHTTVTMWCLTMFTLCILWYQRTGTICKMHRIKQLYGNQTFWFIIINNTVNYKKKIRQSLHSVASFCSYWINRIILIWNVGIVQQSLQRHSLLSLSVPVCIFNYSCPFFYVCLLCLSVHYSLSCLFPLPCAVMPSVDFSWSWQWMEEESHWGWHHTQSHLSNL